MTCLTAMCLTIAAGAYSVIDGDTLRVTDAPNIRIWGIDAPEMDTPAGPAARDAMDAIAAGRDLTCAVRDVDRYGRIVARCFEPGGADLACALVRTGHAHDWPRYSGGFYGECGG